MSLKTTYRDDKFSGRRKYRMIENEDGTISFDDVTDYAEEGDIFSSNDINVTNKAINDANEKIKTTKKQIEDLDAELKGQSVVNVPANNWSQSVPYSQKISVPGITAEDSPSVGAWGFSVCRCGQKQKKGVWVCGSCCEWRRNYNAVLLWFKAHCRFFNHDKGGINYGRVPGI